MAKNHRVEIRLSEEDYQTLRERAEQYHDTMTGAIERLLHMGVPIGRHPAQTATPSEQIFVFQPCWFPVSSANVNQCLGCGMRRPARIFVA